MRLVLYSVLFAMVSVSAHAQSDGTITVLSYHYYGPGLWVDSFTATSVDGAGCDATFLSSTGTGAGRWTRHLDAATFAELMAGVKALLAIRDPAQPPPDSGERYVIETTVRNKDGSKSDKYVVSTKNPPEAMRAWLKLLYKSSVTK